MLLLLAALALAAPNFTGTWTLDLDASQSVDALLAASGASWPERAAAGTLSVTQQITQDPKQVRLDFDSALVERSEVLVPDGVPRTFTGKNGTGTVATSWKGDALVTVSDLPTASGQRLKLTATRTLEDGGRTLRQRLELRTPDGQVVVADRIFRLTRP